MTKDSVETGVTLTWGCQPLQLTGARGTVGGRVRRYTYVAMSVVRTGTG